MDRLGYIAMAPFLCRGNGEDIRQQIESSPRRLLTAALMWIILGAGSYGAAVGLWRAPLLAGYVALKLPALILFTTLGNALLNGILAPLAGIPLTFRQSSLSILCSFAIASIILASLTPIALMLVLNAPAPDSAQAAQSHRVILLVHTTAIGFAGVIANVRLFNLLKTYAPTRGQALKVLIAWLGGNMLLGTQLSWIMRPFFGTPSSSVQFLRDNALDGNFFEAVFKSLMALIGG